MLKTGIESYFPFPHLWEEKSVTLSQSALGQYQSALETFNLSDAVSERSRTVPERSGDFQFCPTLSQSALETFNLSDAVSERSRTVSERATNSPVKSCTSS
ncbi:hypothetical protein DFH28DRAFT_928282 [Melampsora americana]|nr:hypothetical protein DFH28DRAFT_928282 [Melampsora americana]